MPYPTLPAPGSSTVAGAPVQPDLAALQPSLLRFARARLRNACLAEDAVSETLLAAWQAQSAFSTPAQAAGWVYGILRHKLVDQLRQQGREVPAGDDLPEPGTRSPDWFVGAAWCGMGSVQAEPEHAYSQRQLLELVLRCCDELPTAQRQAFLLRELMGDEPASICTRLGVTEGNLWVLIHRARLRLRILIRQHGEPPRETTESRAPRRRAQTAADRAEPARPKRPRAARLTVAR